MDRATFELNFKTKIMKTTITLVLMVFFMDPIIAVRTAFEKEMKVVLEQKDNSKNQTEFEECADAFLKIQKKYENEWLPSYYAVNCYLTISMEYATDMKSKDAWVDRAKAPMEFLTTNFSNESEVWVLQSWYYASYLLVEPMTRGMTYGQKSTAATMKALSIDPDNPRAQFLKYQNLKGRAQYTGEDTSELCQNVAVSLNKFDDYPIKSDIYPSWGKDELAAILKQCKF